MNLTQLQASIRAKGYSSGATSSVAQIEDINSAYRRINSLHRWPYLEAQMDLAVTVGTPGYALTLLGTDSDPDAVRLVYSDGSGVETAYMPPQEFRELETAYTQSGEPRYWTVINQAIRVWPTPNRTAVLRVDYIKTAPALAVAADTPIFDSTFHDVIVWGCIPELAFRERDWSSAGFAQSQYMQRIAEMERAYGIRQRQSGRKVRRSSFWEQVGRG